MTFRDLTSRSARSLKSAKARTLLTAFAIAVGTFALTLTLAASNGAQAFVNDIISDNFDPSELIVAADKTILGDGDTAKPQEYDDSFGVSSSNAGASIQIRRLKDDDIEKLKAIKGVEEVREVIDLNLQYITTNGKKKFVATAQALPPAQNPELYAGTREKPIRDQTILLPEGFIKSLGFKNSNSAIGKEVTIAIRKPFTQETITQALSTTGPLTGSNTQLVEQVNPGSVEEKFKIAGVMKKPTSSQPGTELYIFMNRSDIQRLNDFATKGTDNYRRYTFAYVKVKDGTDQTTLNKVQKQIEKHDYVARSVEETQAFLTQIISILRGIVGAFGAIAVIASVFGIINTMYISVLQRTREIGLMKALGMRRRDIGRLFRFEAALIGLLGGVIGAGGGILVGTLLNPWITKILELDPDKSLLIFKFNQIAILIGLLVIISVLAGWLPSRKASKLDPIEALRTE